MEELKVVDSRSCHVFPGALGLWGKDLVKRVRKEGNDKEAK